jgi:hypothetical protein
MANDIDLTQSDSFLNPGDSEEGLLDKITRTGMYAGLGYGGLVGAKAGLKHFTPLTQAVVNPLKKASTRIEGYYEPGITPKGKMSLVMDHWKGSDMPAITEYLEKYKNTRDPFGIPWRDGATEGNINKLRTMMGKYGTMVGLDGGIQTADELKFASRIRAGRDSYWKAVDIGDSQLQTQAEKLIRRNENLLRYEMQKTELIKHSFGEKINQARWKSSGLGRLKTTTLSSALDDNSRALRSWINSTKFGGFGGVSPETKVTAAQYTGKDHSTLIRNAKHFGSSYIKIPYAKEMASVLGRETPVKYMRLNGMKEVAEQAYRYYEGGANREGIGRWLDDIEKASTNKKTKDMITQFRNHHDFVDGKLKVNYSFVSTQQTVAGVNSDMTIWRGKGKSYLRGGKGKLYHNVLVSDMYDVAGGMGATTQKNLHMNIARSTNAGPNALKFAKYGSERHKLYDAMVNKQTKKLVKILPKASKNVLLRLAKLLVFKRI